MKLNTLTPINTLTKEKITALFKKDSNFAWNVRRWVEEGEADYINDIIKSFGETDIEWEFGLYTRTTFRVKHDLDAAVAFAAGCLKAQKEFEFFDEHQMSLVEALGYTCLKVKNNEDPTKEDDLLDFLYQVLDSVAAEVRKNIQKLMEYWESDERIINERLEDFIDCYGEDIYLDPTDDSLVEVRKLSLWD